ncbi:hypothetical protein GTY23_41560 [Streptomyces sp. SID5998]|nr:hypothetical protein [Streptomyces sp. SID5998]
MPFTHEVVSRYRTRLLRRERIVVTPVEAHTPEELERMNRAVLTALHIALQAPRDLNSRAQRITWPVPEPPSND